MSTTFCLNVFFLLTIDRETLAVNITNMLLRYNLTQFENDVEFYLYGHTDYTSDDNKKQSYPQRFHT